MACGKCKQRQEQERITLLKRIQQLSAENARLRSDLRQTSRRLALATKTPQ